MYGMNNKIRIILNQKELIVTNTGKPFDSKGVVAICRLGLSEKIRPEEIDDYGGKRGKSLIEEICKRTTENRWGDRNNFAEDKRSEERTYVDYSGRFIYELLQNADDAMTDSEGNTAKVQYIGEKGLGFKSVLEITSNPQIFSGEYQFEFSEDKLREVLSKYDHLKDFVEKGKLPIFRHPFWVDNKPHIVQELQEEGYSTVIVLPFKSEEAKEKACKYLRSFDFKTLLFVRNVEEVKISSEETNENIDIYLIREFTGTSQDYEERHYTFEVSSGNETKEEYNFILWLKEFNISDGKDKGNVSIAVKTEDFKGFEPLGIENNKLFVFFPTEEDLPLNFILHATFDIESNRKHVSKDSDSYELALKEIGTLLRDVISSRKYPAQNFIDTFIPNNEPDYGVAKDIYEQAKEALSDSRFIPVMGGEELYKPSDVRVWSYDFGQIVQSCLENGILNPSKIREFNLVTPEINKLKTKLQKLGAETLENSEYVDILQEISIEKDVEPDLIESLIRLWIKLYEKNKENEEIIESLLLVKIWKTEDGEYRSLKGDVPLFYEDVDIGGYLPHDVLSDDIKKFLEGDDLKEKWKDIKEELREKDVIFINTDASKREAILTYIKGKNSDWWERYGWDCLKDLKRVIKFDSNIDFEDREAIHVPTKDGWKPAILTYAGNSWGVPKELEEFWANIEDRYILLDRDKWEIEIKNTEEWQEFLEKLGVSWVPKVWKIEKGRILLPFHMYNQPRVEEFPYTKDIFRKYFDWTYAGRDKKLRENWWIEFFPECILTIQEFNQNVIDLVLKLYKLIENKKLPYKDWSSYQYDTFARYQIQETEWVSFNSSPTLNNKKRFKPTEVAYTLDNDTYNQWRHFLPIANFSTLDSQYLSILGSSGIGFRKFPSEVIWFDVIQKISNKEPKEFRLVKQAYSYFTEYGEARSYVYDLKLLTMSNNYRPALQIFYIDQNSYSVFKKDEKYKDMIFVLDLDKGRKFSEKVGNAIRPISNHMVITEIHRESERKFELNKLHVIGIKSIIQHSSNNPEQETGQLDILLRDYKIKAVKNLRITCCLEGMPKRTINVPFFINEDEKKILAGEGQEYKAIAEFINRRDLEDTIDKLLRLKQRDEVIEFLKEKGISEDTIREIEQLKEEVKEVEPEFVSKPIVSVQITSGRDAFQLGKSDRKRMPEGKVNTKDEKPSIEINTTKEQSSERRSTRSTSSTERERGQESREAGEKAEDYIEKQLRELLQNDFIIERRKRIYYAENNFAEVDFHLRNKATGKEAFIEVKSIKSGNTIYWYASEAGLAKEKGERYFIVCVKQLEEKNQYVEPEVYYLVDPYSKWRNRKVETIIEQPKEVSIDSQEGLNNLNVSENDIEVLNLAMSKQSLKKKFRIDIDQDEFEEGVGSFVEKIRNLCS